MLSSFNRLSKESREAFEIGMLLPKEVSELKGFLLTALKKFRSSSRLEGKEDKEEAIRDPEGEDFIPSTEARGTKSAVNDTEPKVGIPLVVAAIVGVVIAAPAIE